jgi:transposase-like protein
MEDRVQAAVEYLKVHPDATESSVARDFGITRSLLRSRRAGRNSYSARPTTNKRLSEAEEKAIRNYIDRLDRINLNCRASFV